MTAIGIAVFLSLTAGAIIGAAVMACVMAWPAPGRAERRRKREDDDRKALEHRRRTGDRFDRKAHIFGMAYRSARHTAPFYPVCLKANYVIGGMGDYCECAAIDGASHVPAQWLNELYRAPEFDLISKTKTEGDFNV